MKTATILIGAALIIGAVVGGAFTYWYTAPGEEVTPSVYYQPSAVTERAADISASLNDTTYNFTSAVDANGSVATAVTIDKTLTITNNDEKTAKDLMITLYNPVTEKEGLSDYLETTAFKVYVISGGMSNAIFYDGDYITDTTTSPTTYGYNIGNLAPGGSVTLTVRIVFDTCVDGTFQDGQTYSNQNLYVYQPHSQYANTVSFTVET